jgi:hypothetical protein
LKLGWPAVGLETQEVRATLKVQRRNTNKANALGIALIRSNGWFRKAHNKRACYRLRLFSTHRRNLMRKLSCPRVAPREGAVCDDFESHLHFSRPVRDHDIYFGGFGQAPQIAGFGSMPCRGRRLQKVPR